VAPYVPCHCHSAQLPSSFVSDSFPFPNKKILSFSPVATKFFPSVIDTAILVATGTDSTEILRPLAFVFCFFFARFNLLAGLHSKWNQVQGNISWKRVTCRVISEREKDSNVIPKETFSSHEKPLAPISALALKKTKLSVVQVQSHTQLDFEVQK